MTKLTDNYDNSQRYWAPSQPSPKEKDALWMEHGTQANT